LIDLFIGVAYHRKSQLSFAQRGLCPIALKQVFAPDLT
jgi:hypothetical protein